MRVLVSLSSQRIQDLLESFVPDWRGWAEERSWHSIDSDLVLHARHDRVGQVVIRVVLRNMREDWAMPPIELVIELGHLEQLAADCRAFLDSLSPP